MKTKFFISITISILVGFLIICGCATTARITKPTSPDSTMLMGRIRVICAGFSNQWFANGEHTNGVEVVLKDISSNKTLTIIARGADGLFHLVDPGSHRYTIIEFNLQTGDPQTTFKLTHTTSDSFQIDENSVNNLGDIVWRCEYVSDISTEYGKSGSYTKVSVNSWLEYKGNYDEVKSWFEETYPKSVWNNKKWENAQINK